MGEKVTLFQNFSSCQYFPLAFELGNIKIDCNHEYKGSVCFDAKNVGAF
jgi:hypothetical protein